MSGDLPSTNEEQALLEQVYFSADTADAARQTFTAQRHYEKLANIIQTQQFSAEQAKDLNKISNLADLQTSYLQPKASALFEYNYKNIYQQLPQDVLNAVAKRLQTDEPHYNSPLNVDLFFKNFPLPKTVPAQTSQKPSFKNFKPIKLALASDSQTNGANTNNNRPSDRPNGTSHGGTYVSPFVQVKNDPMDESDISSSNPINGDRSKQPSQSDQLLPSRIQNNSANNNNSNNGVNGSNRSNPAIQRPAPPNNNTGPSNNPANKTNGAGNAKGAPNMNAITNSLLSKRPRNTFYGRAPGEEDEDEEPSPPQQEKPRDFKTGFERLQEENAKNGHPTNSSASNANSRQLLGKRKRTNFQTPFKKSQEEEEEAERAAKKAKETNDNNNNPLYKNVDPDMIQRIENEILEAGVNVKFDDIAGLENVKRTLDEMIIQPAKRPDLFQGLRAPPRGLLLFGPPGNGKTMIAKAIATEAGLTFFSISASSLTSKWIGEGEKMVRALFAVARVHQPSFIFIDEVDALLAMRSNEEHESSRRLKNEFLTQFDGATSSAKERVTVMGATNRPQDLDEAARRRLVRRIYVPLPSKIARTQLMEHLLSSESHDITRGNLQELGDMTEGYSGHDISNLCKDAAMGPLREHKGNLANVDEALIRPLNMDDFRASLTRIKPSVAPEETQQFEDWNNKFGVSAF